MRLKRSNRLLQIIVVGILMLASTNCNKAEIIKPIVKQNRISIKNTSDCHLVFNCFGEAMPQFPGGDSALIDFLRSHIRYPKAAMKKGLKGIVIVQFTINKDGSLSRVSTVGKKIGGGLEEEAIAGIKNMPKWIPASINGIKVNVKYSLPVRYVLQ